MIALLNQLKGLVEDNTLGRWQEMLKNSKLYLKADFKVHVDDEATIADHCMSYALSDPSDSCFQQKCQHTHGDHCFQCEELGTVLDEIQVAVEEASFPTKDDHDEATYLVSTAGT
ncbi:hypothetical protein ABFA07_013842 [Porites harrisoni]